MHAARGGFEGGAHRATSPRSPASTVAPDDPSAIDLVQQLRSRSTDYQAELAADLTVVQALIDLGDTASAVAALDGHRGVLRALEADLGAAVADATVQREAVRVVEAAQGAVPPAVFAAGGSLRRGFAGALAAAAVAFAAVSPLARGPIRTTLTSSHDQEAQRQLAEAREQLAALQSGSRGERVTADARALHDVILQLPDQALASADVRAEITAILRGEQQALAGMVEDVPAARGLLQEIAAIGATLDLDLEQVVEALPVPGIPAPTGGTDAPALLGTAGEVDPADGLDALDGIDAAGASDAVDAADAVDSVVSDAVQAAPTPPDLLPHADGADQADD